MALTAPVREGIQNRTEGERNKKQRGGTEREKNTEKRNKSRERKKNKNKERKTHTHTHK